MTTVIKDVLNQLPNDGIDTSHKYSQLPIEAVDKIAASLTNEYSNPEWHKWYCGVIYEFGPSKVHEWQRRASEGREPSKLFSTYVSQSRRYKGHRK